MRFRARLVLGLYGVALAVPAVVMAGPLGDDESMGMQPPPQMQAEPHHHKGLFGRRHCVECQRARVMARDGIDIPAPPPIDSGMQGQVISNVAHCPTCQGNMVVAGPMMASQDAHTPGYAVVGGPDAAGYAVVGDAIAGSEPAPVGVAKARVVNARWTLAQPQWVLALVRARSIPQVVPTSLPPGQVALASPPSNRPHIISHLFGLPDLGRSYRERQDRERQKHASISYGQSEKPVTELPASVVYGKDNR